MTVVVYGIRNCDTVKKARAWLDVRRVDYEFHDYKTAGVDVARLAAWADAVGWERLFNRRGTTFRGLAEADRGDVDRDKAIALMAAHPSLIKRPVMERDGPLLVGFDPAEYEAAFG